MTGKRVEVNKNRIIFAAVGFFICIWLVFCDARGVCANETDKDKIEKYRDSIVHIESICWDGENNVFRTKSFSGFVVSKDTSGIYVVTVNNNLTYNSEEKEHLKTELKLEDNVRFAEKIEVVFSGDLRVPATVVGESEQRNLTVLKLGQTINFENILQFSEKDVSDTEQIYLLSYPKSVVQSGASYNSENVLVTSGTVLESYLIDEIEFFKHDIQTDENSVGGPVLNSSGNVVGVLLTSDTEEAGTAVSGETLKSFLNTYNVSYSEYKKVVKKNNVPLLNIILGIIIVGLILVNIVRLLRGKAAQDKGTEASEVVERTREYKGKKRKRKHRNMNSSSTKAASKKAGSEVNINAAMEYPAESRFVNIHKKNFIIGRSQNADFSITEKTGISRQHAAIQFDGRKFYLTDLNSTNHTFLNGFQVMPDEKKVLNDRDEILIGKEKMIFHIGGK